MGFPNQAYQDIRTEVIQGVEMRCYYPRPTSLSQMLKESVARWGPRECLVFNGKRLTYAEFSDEVRLVAEALTYQGMGSGARIALLMENRLEFPVAYYAVQEINAVAVVLNARLKTDKLELLLRDSDAQLLIVAHDLWQSMAGVRHRLPTLQQVVVLDANGQDNTGPDTLSWQSFLDKREHYSTHLPIEDAIAALLYTSGTTGMPKGAIQTHRNLISNAMNMVKLLEVTPEDRTLLVAPAFHATAVNSQIHGMLYAGGATVIRPYFKTGDFVEQLEQENISIAIGVATMFWFMLEFPTLANRDLSSLRYIVYGGSPAPTDLISRLKRQFPAVRLGNVWGLTECTSITTLLADDAALSKPDSVGKPAPTLEVRVDLDSQDVGVGQLLVKGPSVIPGYWHNDEATRSTIHDGWLQTGDIGRIDEDGFVYVLDRIKDMIIRGGQNIYSIEVENVLYQHPQILDAAVVGIADVAWGERVKAFVVPKPETTPSVEEIQEFCRARLARYMVPETIRLIEALPRNPGGKVLKDVLRATED